ncbi:NAD-dependent epimerase/dehydratase family protein [Metallibacterium sp.]|uniref:NAD-dependent epimerase/dehydratase family protein n=1 Tax=Metallibacterium sp. TaxID=2940281 RepID=UPI002610E668|nr:NAD-dependent epimerase/dehydratase family protein [Metallibacterium sp.]
MVSENASPLALLTGSRGFTGRYLRAELAQAGYRVLGVVQDGAVGVDEIALDLRDRDATLRALAPLLPAVVVHLAGIAQVAHGDAAALYQTNLIATRNLLEALAQCAVPPRAVLLASSGNVYGNLGAEVLDESMAPQPANDYAVSKLAMEHMARLWMARLPIILARPFNYTGVGQSEDFLLPKIVGHFRHGARVIELGNTHVARDFSDVRDVARCYRKLLQVPAAIGQTLNVCSGRLTTLDEVLQLMQHIAGYAIGVRVNPAFVRGNEIARLRGNDARLRAVLDDAPGGIPLCETLRWMFAAPW